MLFGDNSRYSTTINRGQGQSLGVFPVKIYVVHYEDRGQRYQQPDEHSEGPNEILVLRGYLDATAGLDASYHNQQLPEFNLFRCIGAALTGPVGNKAIRRFIRRAGTIRKTTTMQLVKICHFMKYSIYKFQGNNLNIKIMASSCFPGIVYEGDKHNSP